MSHCSRLQLVCDNQEGSYVKRHTSLLREKAGGFNERASAMVLGGASIELSLCMLA